MSNKFLSLSLAAAVAGAVSLASVAFAADAPAAGEAAKPTVKCYGIAKAGENDCASKAGKHDCAGKATSEALGREFKLVATKAACKAEGGKLRSFKMAAAKKPPVKSGKATDDAAPAITPAPDAQIPAPEAAPAPAPAPDAGK